MLLNSTSLRRRVAQTALSLCEVGKQAARSTSLPPWRAGRGKTFPYRELRPDSDLRSPLLTCFSQFLVCFSKFLTNFFAFLICFVPLLICFSGCFELDWFNRSSGNADPGSWHLPRQKSSTRPLLGFPLALRSRPNTTTLF